LIYHVVRLPLLYHFADRSDWYARLLCIALVSFLWSIPAFSQALGYTSLITVPSADMPADGSVTFGGGFVDKKYTTYVEGIDYTPYYVTVQFLPFLEGTLRFSRLVKFDRQNISRVGDRVVMGRIRVLEEKGTRPGVVLGAHDFITAERGKFFNALYVVASKHVRIGLPIGFHLGYGTDAIDSVGHQFVGVFGGMAVAALPHTLLMIEFDGDRVNAGARFSLVDHFQVMAGLQGMDVLIAGASIRVQL